MKSVLISIKPRWCELIARGEKTIVIRKTKPRIDTPFKCYIYCTKDKNISFWTGKCYSYADDRSHNLFDLGYTSTGNMCVVKLCMCGSIGEDGSVTYGNKPEFTIPITHWAELPEASGRY